MNLKRHTANAVTACFLAANLFSAGSALAQRDISEIDLGVDGQRILNADQEPGNWLAHGRTYDEQRFSPLDSINDENVGELGLAWSWRTDMGRGHEASPIVVDGVMFITLPWSKVVALDATTGEPIWNYDPQVPPEVGANACCDVVNRGVALWEGKIYVGTIDGRLVALDAKTGEEIWDEQTTDPNKPYTITGAPRVVNGKVVIGNGGAEYGVRGYITAYDANTGEQEWRFYTVPGNPEYEFEHPELEEAAETWNGRWWEMGGGGTAWDSMAYDAELNTLYVGTGNGSPWNREERSPGGGDNLFLSSILAINPDTGRLKWHYQTTPADTWDYTATQHIILADMEMNGEPRKVLMQAPKNGFFYVLDRETGELLSAENFVNITWASHVNMETGRPVETEGNYMDAIKVVYPSPFGGHNWHPMSYNPKTGLVYIPTIDAMFPYVRDTEFEYKPGRWNTGVDFVAVAELAAMGPMPVPTGQLKAWDPVAQKEVWRIDHPGTANGGLLSTAGNLVFQGTSDGRFVAYSADSGEKLWESPVNVGIIAPPVAYAVDGEQYIAVQAGWGGAQGISGLDAGISAASRYANMGHMLAYKLGGDAPMPDIPAKRFTTIPPPPESDASTETIKHGQQLFHQSCAVCHGTLAISAGVTSDLRFLSKSSHEFFDKILLEGALEDQGMPSFGDLFTAEEVEAIHAYIIERARADREAQLKEMAE